MDCADFRSSLGRKSLCGEIIILGVTSASKPIYLNYHTYTNLDSGNAQISSWILLFDHQEGHQTVVKRNFEFGDQGPELLGRMGVSPPE